MSIIVLDKNSDFPPVEMARADGLLAIGGDLTLERLLSAYSKGIFPWFEDRIPKWWSPNPRFILLPDEIRISKSMQQVMRKKIFRFAVNTHFAGVISACRTIRREGQRGTWITAELETAFNALHQQGFSHSAETWQNNELVGGLYGMRMGKIFFGESMFSLEPNASKFAFINYVAQLKSEGVELIDCQVYTPHLESLGARMIPRKDFMEMMTRLIHP